jgi:hypothetical protein
MISMRSTLALFAWFLTGCLTGCKEGISPRLAPLPPQVRSASEKVVLGGVTVRLETYLWRDFQPVSPPDGKPLMAVLRVRSVDGAAVPSTTRADSVWIINGATTWVAGVLPASTAGDTTYIEVFARDGPKWGPGIHVHVVLRVRDGSTPPVLLRSTAQPIHRTS